MTVICFAVDFKRFRMILEREGSPGLLMSAHLVRSYGASIHEEFEIWLQEGTSIVSS